LFNRILTAASAAALLAAAPASAVVYSINVGDSTLGAIGFIETDGTIGTISGANIVDWGFDLFDNGVNFTLNGPSNSGQLVVGSDLSTTASGLFFNFSGSGLALFQNPNIGSGINFICFAATTGCDGVGNGIRISTNTYGDGIPQSGLQQIGTASGGAVPEPASWAMLIAGFGLVGAIARRRRTAVAA
jgi:PEP-CTERM motif